MKDLTQGNIFKTFFLFGLPMVLSGLLSQAYGIIDTAIAGQFLGETGLAAIGATSPLVTFLSAVFWGYGVGFSIYVAKLFSTKQYKQIKAAVYSNFLLMFFFAVVICGCMIAFHDPIFDLLQIDSAIRSAAFDYFLFYIIGLFPIVMMANFGFVLNSFGIGSFPFYMSLISAVINVSGNILCVVTFQMGIKGLAIASGVASLVVDVCYFFKFRSCLKEMGVQREKVKLQWKYIKNALPFALPNMAQQTVMYLASLTISPLVNGMGESASASYSVVSRLYDLISSVYSNSARSLSNYSAQCVGAKKFNKIRKGVWVGLLQGIAFVTPFILFCCLFPQPICSVFLKTDADALTREYSYTFAQNYLPFIYINLVCNLFHGLFRGVKATGHLFCTTFLGAVFRYVFSALLIPQTGMHGFYLGWVLSWAAEAIFAVVLFFIGKWTPREARERKSNKNSVMS